MRVNRYKIIYIITLFFLFCLTVSAEELQQDSINISIESELNGADKITEITSTAIEHIKKGKPQTSEQETPKKEGEKEVQKQDVNTRQSGLKNEGQNENKDIQIKTQDLNTQSKIQTYITEDDRTESANNIIERVRNFNSVVVVNSRALTPIKVSLKDVSRIVCPGSVVGKVFSGEKSVEVRESGDSLFVKNLPVLKDGRYEYDRTPKDLFVICEDNLVFSLLLVPDDVPSVTVYLQRYTNIDNTKARNFEKENSYIESLIKLIKYAYRQEVPEGYDVININTVKKEYEEGLLIHRLDMIGSLFLLEEYILQARKNIVTDELYWAKELGNMENILAVSVIEPVLSPGEETRILIVRKNNPF